MTRQVSHHELAELELDDAADFYDSREPGLGVAFILGVRQAVFQISEHPESCPVARGNARRKGLAAISIHRHLLTDSRYNSYSRDRQPAAPTILLAGSRIGT